MKIIRIGIAITLQLVATALLFLAILADTAVYVRLVIGWNAIFFFCLALILQIKPKLLMHVIEWLPLP